MAIVLNDEKSIGLIIGSSFSALPPGYLLCDGSVISRTTYAALFSVISTTYGSGDGSTTFNLPDLRGAVPRGAGTSTGYTENVTIALGSKQNDQMQGHYHGTSTSGGNWTNNTGGYLVGTYNASAVTGNSVTDGTNGTPRTGNETRMKNLGVNFFIKF